MFSHGLQISSLITCIILLIGFSPGLIVVMVVMGSDTGRSKSSLDQFSALFFSSTSGSAGLSRQSMLTHTVEWEILAGF